MVLYITMDEILYDIHSWMSLTERHLGKNGKEINKQHAEWFAHNHPVSNIIVKYTHKTMCLFVCM